MDIPFFKLSPVDRERTLVNEVLESGWLTTGRFAKELEANFASYCGVPHALAVNSCTAALHLAVEALGVGAGDAVVVPSLTFTASAEVIRYVGADPIFVDVDSDTGLMSGDSLRSVLSARADVKAVIAVHFAGQAVELVGQNGIWTICQEFGVKLIQDAAHAFPAYDSYGPIGSIGDVTCFSFYANKTMTTGEGGMLVTSDPVVAKRVGMMRLHGIDRDVWDRFTNKNASSWMYDVKAPGFKYNMPDLNAAVGVAQFEKAFQFREQRQRVAKIYLERLSSNEAIEILSSRVGSEQHSWHLFPIQVSDCSVVTRDELMRKLAEAGIGTSVHYRPLHQMSYYQETYKLDPLSFPNAEAYWQRCLSLPIYPSLTDGEVDYICDRILEVIS